MCDVSSGRCLSSSLLIKSNSLPVLAFKSTHNKISISLTIASNVSSFDCCKKEQGVIYGN